MNLACCTLLVSLCLWQVHARSSRVFNGSDATVGLIPWQAALDITKPDISHLCGGTLIHPNWVLTAAQCLHTATQCTVRLGSLNSGTGGQAFENLDTTSFFVHSGYDSSNNNHDNDIALVKLPTAAVLSRGVKPIKMLGTGMEVRNTTVLRLSGWGNTMPTPQTDGRVLAVIIPPTKLKFADVYSGPPEACTVITRGNSVTNLNNIMCVFSSPSYQQICYEDQGGPLVKFGKSNYVVGVASYAMSMFCEQGSPAVFMKVSSFRDWIRNTTGLRKL